MASKYTRSSSHPFYQEYSIRKGIAYGAFGGFIAIVAFTGIMLWMPIAQGLPTGSFLDRLGSTIIGSTPDAVLRGIVGFGVVLAQGIIVGIIFGIVTSKIKALHPSSKRRGISFGLATGIIAFIVLYLPSALTISSTNLVRYAPADIYTMGVQTATNNNNKLIYTPSSTATTIPVTLGFGIFAYLAYGFLMAGIVTLAYSVYHYDVKRIEEHNDTGDQRQ